MNEMFDEIWLFILFMFCLLTAVTVIAAVGIPVVYFVKWWGFYWFN